MKVILQETMKKLGKIGQVVEVADGYARNFLLPKQKALRATKENLDFFEAKKAELEKLNLKNREEAQVMCEVLDGFFILLVRQAGENGQLYGSVSARDIAEALAAEKFPIDRHQVVLNAPLKNLGHYPVEIELHAEVAAKIHLIISQSKEEAVLEKQKISQLNA